MEKSPPYFTPGQQEPTRPTSPAQSQMAYQPPPQPMHHQPPQPMHQQPPQMIPYVINPQGVPAQSTTNVVMPQGPMVVATGNCPNCRVGFIHEEFSACGIIWAICCFPCGLLCLLGMKDRICINCRTEFS